MHDQHQRLAADTCDRRKVGEGIVAEVLVEADVDRMRLAGAEHQCIAVGR
jgi:hypothetical protein